MESMQLAQDISSMVLALRKKVDIRVRQPLKKILLPVLDQDFQKKVDKVKDLIMAEVNVKEIEYVTDTTGMLTKKVKPNFKTLGKRAGALMKDLTSAITAMNQEEIRTLEAQGSFQFSHFNPPFTISLDDVEVLSEDIPGWQVMNNAKLTVALDITITENLRDEGLARELINRVQNLRKEAGFDVTDHIRLHVQRHNILERAVNNNLSYICGEVLASELKMVDSMENTAAIAVELDENLQTFIHIERN
jgi:isoleucyl-tRNA synthetase